MVLAASAALAAPAAASAVNLPLSCNLSSTVPPLQRAEGTAELAGDIVLVCTGGTPTPAGQPVPQYNLEVFVQGVGVTSRALKAPWNEGLALVDDPPPATQSACTTSDGVCTIDGTGTGTGVYNGSAGRPNVFQGQVVGTNELLFQGLPIDAPGSAGAKRVIRIVNLRDDASASPSPGGLTPAQIIAMVSASQIPLTGTAVVVAFAQHGLNVSLTGNGTQLDCGGQQQTALTMTFTEGFANAFRQRTAGSTDPTHPADQDTPGAVVGASESGFFNSALVGDLADRGDLGQAGLAHTGTRLRAAFTGVPDGTQVFVPTKASLGTAGGQTGALQLVSSESGPYDAVLPSGGGPAGTAPLTVSGGAATAIYEVISATSNAVEFASMPVTVDPGTTDGTAHVSGSFAPLGGSTTPRFASNSGSAPANAFTVKPCPAPPANPPAGTATPPPGLTKVDNRGPVADTSNGPADTSLTGDGNGDNIGFPGPSEGTLGRRPSSVSRRGALTLPVGCNGRYDCDVALSATGLATAAQARASTLGHGRAQILAGERRAVRVRLSRAALSRLRHTGRLRVRLAGTVTSDGTDAALPTTTSTLHLRRG